MKIAMLGAGAYGTALACHVVSRDGDALSQRMRSVTLWTRQPEHAAAMRRARCNQRYLPGVPLDPAIEITADFAGALHGACLWVVSCSVAGLRGVAHALAEQVRDGLAAKPMVWLCKGFEAPSGCLPSEVLAQVWPEALSGVLSGPSFAQEVAAGLPVALTVASTQAQVAQQVVAAFHHGAARIYRSDDVRGVEVGGALKNLLALAAGVSDGLGLGLNARAALLTRGLAEMQRYGVALGARPETFLGLAGVGDALLTCTGDLSRNRRVGLRLAQGETLSAILADLGHVAEGVACCQAVQARARQVGVDVPIIDAVAEVLFAGRDPRAVLASLLAREPKSESNPSGAAA